MSSTGFGSENGYVDPAVMSVLAVSSAASCDRYRYQNLFLSVLGRADVGRVVKDVEVVTVFVMLSTFTNVPVDRWSP